MIGDGKLKQPTETDGEDQDEQRCQICRIKTDETRPQKLPIDLEIKSLMSLKIDVG